MGSHGAHPTVLLGDYRLMFLSLIARAIWARRVRSLMTALGVGIGIGLIIAIFSVVSSVRDSLAVSAQITQADLLAVQRGLAGPTGGSIPEFCVDELESYEGVKDATGFLLTSVSFEDTPFFNIFGVRTEDRGLYLGEEQIVEGTYFQNPGEMGLGKIAADSLGLGVGDTLRLDSGEEFTVVGVFDTGNTYLDSGGITSLKEAQEVVGREGKVTLIAIYLDPEADKSAVAQQIESDKRFLKVISSPRLLETSSTVELAGALSWVLTAIALIMASIFVFNSMSTSVAERTRDIGILKAVGWSRWKVMGMFLGESLLLGLAGFAIGVLFGMGTVLVISHVPAARSFVGQSFDGQTLLVGLIVSLLLGLIGGAIPAISAFRLSPVEALRSE